MADFSGLASLASIFATNIQTQNNAQAQAEAAVQQAGINANNQVRKTQLAVGSQTSRFLSSGLQLVGTPQADAAGTYATGEQDVENIVNNGNNQAGNIYSQARAKMLTNLTQGAKGLGLGNMSLDSTFTSGLSFAPDSLSYALNSQGFGADAYSALSQSDARAGIPQ